ncbi:antibiotic ABC transporter ATP-binding protein [Streptomyces sp. NPDC048603]|uniref:antibiotic ABC transporter ATP-binding protein n=1 Tax=Streptomyces sp. NPDC048603 TaxID=3365577 RepID=UPI003719FB64
MSTVVFVHGVGKQYLSEDSLTRDVVPELLGGIRLAGGPVPAPEDVAVAFYGDLFRPRGTRGGGEFPYEAADVETEDEYRLLMEWWAEAARTDPAVPAPDAPGSRGAAGWAASRALRLASVRSALDALTGAAFLRGMLDAMLIGSLKQLTAYFSDPAVRSEARARVAARITPETKVVVGHSLGSVVAYEALCDRAHHTGWDLPMFVTIGSPLGMRALVLDRLDPAPDGNRRAVWPKPVRAWTNIADSTDIVALVRELKPSYGDGVTDALVHNGSHMHDATRYLTAAETGRAVAAGLRADGGADPTTDGPGSVEDLHR